MGLTATAPLAFAHYGGILTSSGHIIEGCRLGMWCCMMYSFYHTMHLLNFSFVLPSILNYRKIGAQIAREEGLIKA